jgi:eukaryotic-like serine/threonine-protein kinase
VPSQVQQLGRYDILGTLGRGGMATVLLARFSGPVGFSRPVAIKRLHEQLARDPAFVSMLLDEARLGSHVRHPCVAEVIDLIAEDGEACLVMQYVHGPSLRNLIEAEPGAVPAGIACAVMCDALIGLHAAHEARGPDGKLLGIVHRDVSPHNLLVGLDGFTRVTDFGIAKAAWRAQSTGDGQLKGKLAYMAPEQITHGQVDRRADIFGAAVVLWELLAGRRLFEDTNPEVLVERTRTWRPPSIGRSDVAPALDAAVARGLAPERSERFESAMALELAIRSACSVADRSEVSAWVQRVCGPGLARRAAQIGGNADVLPPSAWKSSPDTGTLPQADSSRPTPAMRPMSAPPRDGGGSVRAAGIVAIGLLGLGILYFAGSRSTGNAGSAPASFPQPSEAVPVASAAPSVLFPQAPVSAPTASAAAAPKVAKPAAPRPVSCDPPFRIDDAGVKVFKVECL